MSEEILSLILKYKEIITFIITGSYAFYKFYYKIDDVSLKRVDRKFEILDKKMDILEKLKSTNISNIIKMECYNNVFDRDLSWYDISDIEVIMKTNNLIKALSYYKDCSGSITIKDSKFQEEKDNKGKCKEVHAPLWSILYLICTLTLVVLLIILPNLFEKFSSNNFIALLIAYLFLWGWVMYFMKISLDKLSIKRKVKWLLENNKIKGCNSGLIGVSAMLFT